MCVSIFGFSPLSVIQLGYDSCAIKISRLIIFASNLLIKSLYLVYAVFCK